MMIDLTGLLLNDHVIIAVLFMSDYLIIRLDLFRYDYWIVTRLLLYDYCIISEWLLLYFSLLLVTLHVKPDDTRQIIKPQGIPGLSHDDFSGL